MQCLPSRKVAWSIYYSLEGLIEVLQLVGVLKYVRLFDLAFRLKQNGVTVPCFGAKCGRFMFLLFPPPLQLLSFIYDSKGNENAPKCFIFHIGACPSKIPRVMHEGLLEPPHGSGEGYPQTHVYHIALLSSHEHDPCLVQGNRSSGRSICAKWLALGLSHYISDA